VIAANYFFFYILEVLKQLISRDSWALLFELVRLTFPNGLGLLDLMTSEGAFLRNAVVLYLGDLDSGSVDPHEVDKLGLMFSVSDLGEMHLLFRVPSEIETLDLRPLFSSSSL